MDLTIRNDYAYSVTGELNHIGRLPLLTSPTSSRIEARKTLEELEKANPSKKLSLIIASVDAIGKVDQDSWDFYNQPLEEKVDVIIRRLIELKYNFDELMTCARQCHEKIKSNARKYTFNLERPMDNLSEAAIDDPEMHTFLAARDVIMCSPIFECTYQVSVGNNPF